MSITSIVESVVKPFKILKGKAIIFIICVAEIQVCKMNGNGLGADMPAVNCFLFVSVLIVCMPDLISENRTA